ncbi:MAG: hypothetical protein J7J72_10365 [Bacteroidales bacterium]|nr:hypothetical protein [Bacteroidales bacterium]
MKKILYLVVLLIVFTSCKNNSNNTNQEAENGEKYENFKVKETLLAAGYTYILGEQNDSLKWFAVSQQEINEGEVFYYVDPLVMKDFYSKELDRPFDEITFLMQISKDPKTFEKPAMENSQKPSGKITTDQLDLGIDIPEGAISIAQLYENMKQYKGQKVRVKGQVVKFSAEIMNTNWIHLQDGTSFDGKYDLTITSDETVNVGDIVTFEGVISIDKDFGYGYFYEVLLEETVVIK